MTIRTGEVRVAWALLILLAVLSFPNSPPVGPITLIISGLGFLPGTLILASSRGAARVAGEVESLLTSTLGRVSILVALALAVMFGIIFDIFVALSLVGAAAQVVWLVLLLSPNASLVGFFPGLTVSTAAALFTLVSVDVFLNRGSIAWRLGTPGEVARQDKIRDNLEATNFFRFRSVYEDTRRRPGVRRVLALGDSFTGGSGIPLSDSTWPAQLEKELSRGPDCRPTEVINTGHGGYTTANEAELLRRIGWQFDPDLVIVQWLDNDAYGSYPNMQSDNAPIVRLVPPRFRTGLIKHSAILELIETRIETAIDPGIRSTYAPNSPGWLQLQAALKEMGDSAARHGVPILLVTYPYLFEGSWTPATYPYRDLNRMVIDVARPAGFEILDLTNAFAAANRPWQEWWVTPYNSHPNGAGQHIAMVAIARYIREHHLLPDDVHLECRCERGTSSVTRPLPAHDD